MSQTQGAALFGRPSAIPPGAALFPRRSQQLGCLLDDEIVEAVRADMAGRSPRSSSRGRTSTLVEVVLRMLVVMRLYGWSYEQAEYCVNDSLVLRHFCRVYLERVPDDTTLIDRSSFGSIEFGAAGPERP